jgi:hypothetical protein
MHTRSRTDDNVRQLRIFALSLNFFVEQTRSKPGNPAIWSETDLVFASRNFVHGVIYNGMQPHLPPVGNDPGSGLCQFLFGSGSAIVNFCCLDSTSGRHNIHKFRDKTEYCLHHGR